MNVQETAASAITPDTTKVALVWSGFGVSEALRSLGIHNWSDASGAAATALSLILICDWAWKKYKNRKSS